LIFKGLTPRLYLPDSARLIGQFSIAGKYPELATRQCLTALPGHDQAAFIEKSSRVKKAVK
jgi:hypothetical protein